MPNYDYRCKKCGQTWELQLPLAERLTPTKVRCDCGGKVEQYLPSSPGFGYDMVNFRHKVPDSFKDVLRNIKHKHRGSNIDV